MICYILTKNADNIRVFNLFSILSNYYETRVIEDVKEDVIFGYTGATSTRFKPTTSWDLFFRDVVLEQDAWVFEDDVAFTKQCAEEIFKNTEQKPHELLTSYITSALTDQGWWWHNRLGIEQFISPKNYFKSLNCFCRIKTSLLNTIKEFQNKHNHYIFHEAMLPSFAKTRFDMSSENIEINLNHQTYDYRSVTNVDNVDKKTVYHSVKGYNLHTFICSQ